MIKDTLISLYVVALFIFISLLFSCSKDSDLLVENTILGNTAIETDSNGQEASQENVSIQLSSPFPYCQSDPNPIGGGTGYTAILTPSDATTYINTFTSIADFKNTIENAPEGAIIYIDDALSIDLTGLYNQTGSASILVPANITIASGRGHGPGALIYTNDFGYWGNKAPEDEPLFRVAGDNVRFTGIRLKGPSQELGSDVKSDVKNKRAISTNGFDGLEVDNCELFGWPFASIQIGGENTAGSFLNNKIHHNSIYNNRQKSLGYGVLIFSGYTVISNNIFMANRHDVAGGGQAGSGYEASCNLILSGGVGHNFDMHAEGPQDATPNAGSFIFIHHNDFEDIGAHRYAGQGKDNIIIRGRPEIQCRIENNRFKHTDPLSAIRQINNYGGYGNMLVWNNIYNEKDYLGWYVKKKCLKSKASNFLNLASSNDDFMQEPENGSDFEFNYAFGDYDGDGNTDIFKLENGFLYTIPLDASTSGPATGWRPLLPVAHPFESLQFGFYDSDERTDLIMQEGNIIKIASGVNTAWQPLLNTTYSLTAMKSGDFNGNGIEGQFLANGSQWKVSHDSNTNWQTLKTSTENLDKLKIGFFNGDTSSDVLMIKNGDILVSFNGTTGWTNLGSTTFEASSVEIADFDGDNLSDIIHPKLGQILINGNSIWQQCQTDIFPINEFPYGDF